MTLSLSASRIQRDAKVLVVLFLASVVPVHAGDLDSLVSHALGFSRRQLMKSIAELDDSVKIPRSTEKDGTWKTVPPSDWTSGFFAGSLWYMYEWSRDEAFRIAAERWTATLEGQKTNNRTHDVGFMMYCSWGNGDRLQPSQHYKEALLQAAQTLSTRFNPKVGCIKSWDGRPQWPYPVIIDNMMNLELLFWASKNGGPTSLRDIAVSHALKTMRNHFRPDGSTFHVVDYDTATGKVTRKQTHQGFADSSTWARGQAWAVYGFTMAYRETHDARLLRTAQRAADYFIRHLPPDCIPFWDFQAPNIPDEPRDASAAAIASSALFELSGLVKEKSARSKYLKAARSILRSLCSRGYLAEGTGSHGLLNHAVGNRPRDIEVDVSLIYGDYYFLEAMMRYTKLRQKQTRRCTLSHRKNAVCKKSLKNSVWRESSLLPSSMMKAMRNPLRLPCLREGCRVLR